VKLKDRGSVCYGNAGDEFMSVRSAILAGAVLAAAFAATPASAVEYPWCAQYGRDGGRNCGFVNLAQCMATVSGIGGSCQRNSFYTAPPPPKRKRHEK
jgi:hypothetical protein